MKQLTDSERLEVVMGLLSERQVDEYASQCEELEHQAEHKKSAEIIARGYEWTCSHCGDFNLEYEYRTEFYCSKCGKKVEMDSPEHAMG